MGWRERVLLPRARPLRASAQLATSRRRTQPPGLGGDWQERAYAFYDSIGEIRYCTNVQARTIELVDIYPAKYDPAGEIIRADEPGDEVAQDVWHQVKGESGGREEIQLRYAQLRFLVGECYLVAYIANTPHEIGQATPTPTWEILSPDELKVRDENTYEIEVHGERGTYQRGDPASILTPGQALAWRLWRPHPRHRSQADSPLRPVLDTCEELRLLRLAIRARARNRATKNGILLYPDEAFLPLPGTTTTDVVPIVTNPAGEDSTEDPVIQRLQEVLLTPLTDEQHASSVVPPTFRVAADYIDKFKMLHLSDGQEAYPEGKLRDECVQAIARGMDMPPEMLTGFADVNHWTGWAITDQAWRHIEPTVQEMCREFTSSFYRPSLQASGLPDPDAYLLWYDASNVVVKPDRGADADQAFDRYAISFEAYREAKGFKESDAPTDPEIQQRVEIDRAKRTPIQDPTLPPTETGQPPTTAARSVAYHRCLELAGSRLRSRLTAPERDRYRAIDNRHLGHELGATWIHSHGLHASELVRGGATCLLPALVSAGVDEERARAECGIVESHAAAALDPPGNGGPA